MNPHFSGMALWREQAFPNPEGEYSWELSHDAQTGVIVVQYREFFFDSERNIDELAKVIQTQLHDVRRRYQERKRCEN